MCPAVRNRAENKPLSFAFFLVPPPADGWLKAPASGRPIQRKPDITLAQKYLSWGPDVELEEGLQETIEYFRTRLAAWADLDDYLPIQYVLSLNRS